MVKCWSKYSNKTQWWKKYTLGMTYTQKIQLRRRERGLNSCRWKNVLALPWKFLIKNEINFHKTFRFMKTFSLCCRNPLSRVLRSIRRSREIFSGISAQYLENFMTWSYFNSPPVYGEKILEKFIAWFESSKIINFPKKNFQTFKAFGRR